MVDSLKFGSYSSAGRNRTLGVPGIRTAVFMYKVLSLYVPSKGTSQTIGRIVTPFDVVGLLLRTETKVYSNSSCALMPHDCCRRCYRCTRNVFDNDDSHTAILNGVRHLVIHPDCHSNTAVVHMVSQLRSLGYSMSRFFKSQQK